MIRLIDTLVWMEPIADILCWFAASHVETHSDSPRSPKFILSNGQTLVVLNGMIPVEV